jgi:hypothetical protein
MRVSIVTCFVKHDLKISTRGNFGADIPVERIYPQTHGLQRGVSLVVAEKVALVACISLGIDQPLDVELAD